MTSATSAVRSGVVVTGTSLSIRLLNLVSIAILARILEPADFGAVALGIVVVTSTQMLSTVGMGSALIASEHEPRSVAFHAFLINLGLGLMLFTLAFGLADELAALLGGPGLGDLFRLMSVIVLINVVGVVPDALLIKELQFGRRAVTQFVEMLAQVTTSIAFALAGFGATSLALGLVVAAVVGVVSRIAISPRIGWLRLQPWRSDVAWSLFRFGGTAMATGLIRQAYSYSDNVLIGRLFGTRALGFYSQAYNITNLTVQNISQVVNTVLLPVYAKVGGDAQRTAEGFHRTFRLVGAITIPAAAGMFVLAPQAIPVLLGPQWGSSVVLLQILAVMTLFRPLAGTTHPLFLGMNRPELSLRVAVAQALALVPLAALLMTFGVPGIALAVGLTFAWGCLYSIRLATIRAGVPIAPRRLFLELVPILAASLLMGGVVAGTRALVGGSELATVPGILLLVAIGMVTYAAFLWLLDRTFAREVIQLGMGVLEPVTSRYDWARLRRARRTFRTHWVDLVALAARLRRRARLRRPPREPRVDRSWQPGLPPGFPTEACPVVGLDPQHCRHAHLSGWKSRGAWRIADDTPPTHSVVYKDADYDPVDVPAVADLPVRPGRFEWQVLHTADPSLRSWLPILHWARHDGRDRRYQYVLEDLGTTHRSWQVPSEIVVLAERLPQLHGALSVVFDHAYSRPTPMDREASLALVDYLEAGLMPGHGSNDEHEAGWIRHEWPGVRDVYLREGERAFDLVRTVGIHGDCNLANVLFPHAAGGAIKLLDWEWAGRGLPQADLASMCKALPKPVERSVVRAYHEASPGVSWEVEWRVYQWCKLQRGLLDAAFLSRQRLQARHVAAALPLDRHVEAALARAHLAFDELRGRWGQDRRAPVGSVLGKR